MCDFILKELSLECLVLSLTVSFTPNFVLMACSPSAERKNDNKEKGSNGTINKNILTFKFSQ